MKTEHILPVTIGICLLAVSVASAEIYLTGAIEDTLGSGRYRVREVLQVEEGKTLVIEAGTILMFENFSTLLVDGLLIALGEKDNPVEFTSIHRDSLESKPGAFDWNGIKITPRAEGVYMRHARIFYGTFGLSVESKTTPILLEQTSLRENGYSSLTRDGDIMEVWEGLPMDYRWNEEPLRKYARNGIPGTKEIGRGGLNKNRSAGNAVSALDDRSGELGVRFFSTSPRWKGATRIVTASSLVVGVTTWIIGAVRFNKHRDTYNSGKDYRTVNEADDKMNTARGFAIGGMVLSGVSAAGIGVTFVF
ncbi:MAG: hypothetical protein GF344_07610 [Chitinivibrionales bacterium]|nr:hypothetical protein [Chitinivibrionales bacterium]MBD3356765.1 hypothetical protein [Chitinivibrionales bacterium]